MNQDGLKLPPHSIEAESSVLGALLVDNASFDRMGDIDAAAFYSLAHRMIYTAIRNQAAIGKSFDVITTAEVLQSAGKLEDAGGLQYVGRLAADVPSSANIKRYADIVREKCTRRQIIASANEILALGYGNEDVSVAMDSAQSKLQCITDGVKTDEPRSISEIVHEHFNVLEKRLDGGVKCIPTGISEIDSLLNGGFHRGQVIIEAGRPSMGKTALSLTHATHAALKGYGTLVFSMEMVAAELADRALAALGRVSLGHLLSGRLDEDDWTGISAATGKIQDIPLHILDRSGLTFFQVATYARRHKRKHGLDLIVMDYLQLMSGSDPRAPRHAQVEEITRNVKTLAKELNVAIVLLSQLSRKTETARRPKMSDMRDSGSVEQDADVILAIHTEQVDNPDTPWKDYSDVYVLKNRQGALGRVPLKYIGHQVRFEKFDGAPANWDEKPAQQKKRGMD